MTNGNPTNNSGGNRFRGLGDPDCYSHKSVQLCWLAVQQKNAQKYHDQGSDAFARYVVPGGPPKTRPALLVLAQCALESVVGATTMVTHATGVKMRGKPSSANFSEAGGTSPAVVH
eukprot:4755044-Amphidinium_carterae.1